MEKVPTVIPISDLHQDPTAVLNSALESDEPLFIAAQGQPTAVLMSLDTYHRSQAQHELLLMLARGEMEIHQQTGHSLDEIMAEAEGLMQKPSS